MRELIFNILVFTIITSVMKCLIIKEEYKQYFQFFCGLIMIMIVITPVMKFFEADEEFYDILNEHIYSSELKDSISGIKNAEDNLKKEVVAQCEQKIENQIMEMAEKDNVTCKGVNVETRTVDDELEILKVTINTKSGAVAAYSNDSKGAGQLNRAERKLKRDVCDNYMLKGEKVQIWK